MTSIECVTAAGPAAVLLDRLRLRVLGEAREPLSATEIAGRLRLPRQKVNYHVRELARAGLLRRAGQRKKRNMIERRWVATARHYVLAPQLLGELRADAAAVGDAHSAAFLLAVTARAQADLAEAARGATAEGKRLATLGVECEFRFESAAQRAAFTEALRKALVEVVSRHTSPAAGPGRPFRLIAGCYPVPKESENARTKTARS
jgi:DNA-binding transcriptional ArsR family regulator